MKHLILMRHAKSSWDHPDLDDHERPLNQRGIAGAQAMADWLKTMGARPDHAIVSDSARTQETWALLSAGLGLSVSTDVSRDYYLASPETMLDAIRQSPTDAATVIVIGHQPGMSTLVQSIADGSEPTSRSRAFQHFPTAATALIDIPVESWSDVDFGKGVFTRFASPKELATT